MVLMSTVFTLGGFCFLGYVLSRVRMRRPSKAVPPPLPTISNKTAVADHVAVGWEPMSSRELFTKLGLPDGLPMVEYPLSSKSLFESLGMPEGYPVLPDTQPVLVQAAAEVLVDLPPEILREEEPLQPWEIAYAETVDA